ncbi:MAG: hypothetical protein NZ823_17170, partial [Blastocatellia bacterium]|nr:hypothetical protein [Blastocatellia bacterium]
MTTFYEEMKRCAICGEQNECVGIASTSEFGSPDLDTRPPEMTRSTIFTWVERCWICGYSTSDISRASDQTAAIVRSAPYRKQLTDATLPYLANSFLCKAILDESVGDYASAGWAIIHAAWVCDDSEKPESAKECRSRAADMVLKAIEAGQEFTKQRGGEIAILVDLLRRAGRFSEAKELIARKRDEIKDDIILKVLAFQAQLITRGD